MESRDLTAIRLVGTFALLAGTMLMLFTIVTGFLLLLTTTSSTASSILFRGLGIGLLAIVMALALIGCGGTMRRLRPGLGADRENLRLIWTTLFIVMLLCVPAAIWLAPPLADLAALILAALWIVRGAVIRLTNR